MEDEALGLIETKGLVGAIEASDAMAKTANVEITTKDYVGGALVTIMVRGDLGSVQSAIDAGASAARRVGELISAHIIPRPDNQIDRCIEKPPATRGKK